MQEINILFSSVGRRVELVNAFREASRNLNIKSNLIGIDIDELAPALKFVDKAYKVPPIFSEDFIPRVIEICRIEKVSLIISTLYTELLKYSKNKELIKRVCGAKVMVSEEETISIIRDKIKTHNFLKEKEFDVPKLITDKDIDNKDYRFPSKSLNTSTQYSSPFINS